MTTPNRELRMRIASLITKSGEGHIPSSFSIIDLVETLYSSVLKVRPDDPQWGERDYFVLSKGHGAAALYVVLNKMGFFSESELHAYSSRLGLLGGHPDVTIVPGVEASTGSLGHGFPTAIGIALGLRIRNMGARTFCLVGDGECHEGTIWESANVGANLKLGNLCVIVDLNGSAAQLMPHDNMVEKWKAFGWRTVEVDGHDVGEIAKVFDDLDSSPIGTPTAIIAHTTKGKGVTFIEGHGRWHHRIPNEEEFRAIEEELQ